MALPSPLSTGGLSGMSPEEKTRLRKDRILNQLSNVEWQNKNALEYISAILSIPGMGLPDVFDETKGGCAIWRKRSLYGLQTESIKICDECVPMKCLTMDCCGFVYVTINFKVEDCKCADELMTLSGHVIIDKEKGTVKARGDSLQTCIAVLVIVTGVGVCRVEPSKAKYMKADDKAILLARSSDPDFKRMIDVLQNNLAMKR